MLSVTASLTWYHSTLIDPLVSIAVTSDIVGIFPLIHGLPLFISTRCDEVVRLRPVSSRDQGRFDSVLVSDSLRSGTLPSSESPEEEESSSSAAKM